MVVATFVPKRGFCLALRAVVMIAALPAALTPYIERYLTEIRPLLLDPVATDAVWGNGDGGAYTYRSIQTTIFR